ncbi:response regulator [Fulvivirgaceae bacterium BMA10]|uniref:Response regulator n=1 Tax=Splendidivirga corallicola TaxID=3051826 RepID=A0ABT8KZR5_9BACT|nr:response regulator [Fulvivirgaceae bacterium BMA10]
MNILIVEDELLISEDIATKLKKADYEIVGQVETGEEALEIVNEKEPDLIIMDIHLNGNLDGIETAAKIKEHHNLPIIYLTDDSRSETLKRAGKTDPENYLVKPFMENQLHAAIELAFQHSSQNQSKGSLEQEYYRLDQSIFVRDKERFLRINVEDIIYMQAARSYCEIVTKEKTFTISENLNSVSINFQDAFFVKIHRSYVINMKKITGFEGNMVYLNDERLSISKAYRDDFFRRLRVLK